MSARNTCHQCGSSDIDIDPSRGDAVCMNCGSVLEENAIVSDVQFEETNQGGSGVVGQFVGIDGKGKTLLAGFQSGFGIESREITLRNAHKKLKHLGQILQLNQHCIDTAFNFFKMALSRRLTCGRKNSHVIASCLYITCRTEGTPHLLIDFSDALQIDVYELGHTFLRLATALCISIPAVDPCLYILRFAHKLQFGKKTQEVAMTALKLVQRMKRDWIHTGRRPSGLCGAALLIAARLHDFRRDVQDIVHIVRVHESTLRKRLMEFGETPSSSLTFDEFMSIDLEEEQDPPCFKSARKKDKINKLIDQEEVTYEFIVLQKEIERMLEQKRRKIYGTQKESQVLQAMQEIMEIDLENSERLDASQFITEETLDMIDMYNSGNLEEILCNEDRNLTPLAKCGLARPSANSNKEVGKETATTCVSSDLLDLTGIDDEEIDSYIMSAKEIERKTKLWMQLNEEFLKEQEIKIKRKLEEEAEGKPKKKRLRGKKSQIAANSAGEAIAKMLQEKRISNKINYDVLRNLSIMEEAPITIPQSEQSTSSEPLIKCNQICEKTNADDNSVAADVEDEELEEEDEAAEQEVSIVELLSQHHKAQYSTQEDYY